MLKIAVVDAQGGGLGAAIIKKLIEKCGNSIRITALGTNNTATGKMRKGGAHEYATGEEAICLGVRSADVIIGGIGIVAASGMLGEITPKIARAVSESGAKKILIPVSKCNYYIPGASSLGVSALVDAAADYISEIASNRAGEMV